MRSTIPATLVALGCLVIHAFGCGAESSNNKPTGSGGSAGAGGEGGSAGAGGEGGSGCVPTAEVCDGMDNDCDSSVDEDCPCTQGQTQACYSGPPVTDGVGPCSKGQQTCDIAGKWGACVGEVLPKSKETCNNIDDDCNGQIDDMGIIENCGVGACAVTGIPKCVNGQPGVCMPKPPSLEICDGIDNDCDQLVDEVFPDKGADCDTGLYGPCGVGKKDCSNGAPICIPDIMPVTETCNGIDDDCDGQMDDNLPGTGGLCSTGLPGACSNGAIQCNGITIDCFPIAPQSAEKCNGIDDDCDGIVDENDPEGGMGCDSGGVGACGVGTTHCTNGALTCTPNTMGTPEQCNGLDDDCDGTIDDGNPGGGGACGCGGTLVCALGKLNCQGGPLVYLQEDFTDAPGWVAGTQWEIKSTPPATTCGDPTVDYTPSSSDNMLAGVVVGGCAPAAAHAYYYLTSPAFDASTAPSLFLQFRRWLRSDSAAYMSNVIEVYDGANWITIWQGNPTDTSWQKVTYDVGAYKNDAMKVRFGFNITGAGAFQVGSWNVDDVVVASAPCQ